VDQANGIVTTLLEFVRSRAPRYEDRDWAALVALAVEEAPVPPACAWRSSRAMRPEPRRSTRCR